MDYRIEYIAKLFEKISKKRYENYVISRIWHKLSDNEVEFVPQQYVKRNETKYSLTDLYLPQIGLHIEVNEPAHNANEEKILADRIRNQEIIKQTNHNLKIIDFSTVDPYDKTKLIIKSIDEINKDIDELVLYIKSEIEKKRQEKSFKPWANAKDFNPDYHITKGYLNADENPSFRTIEDICKLFGAKEPKRGFLRKGGVKNPLNKEHFIWWPNEDNKLWHNHITDDNSKIFERHNDPATCLKHIKGVLKEDGTRIVFYRNIDVLGFKFYRFKGVYVIDHEQTNVENGIVWKRMDKYIKL
ncbi:MAG: hypothetical protein GX306_03220 [Clostridiales bacterium]|jgi:hypothetical protein|nr:hypothetical protein [Clostridiales bacterium]